MVALVAFALPSRLPGGAEDGFLGSRASDPVARSDLRRDLHLAASPPARFVHFVADAVDGELGHSPVSGVDVGTVVGERLLESLALTAAATGVAFLATRPRQRRRRRSRSQRDERDAPAPSAVPGALWALPLFAAVAISWCFGGIPTADPHSAVVSRVGAGLFPAMTLGIALAAWDAAARRTRRDLLAALFVGTLVTEAVFGLPGLGALLLSAATRPDPLMVRGAVLVIAALAVLAGVTFVGGAGGAGEIDDDLTGGPSTRRRAAGAVLATVWVVALVAATLGRLELRLAPSGRVGARVGAGFSGTHPLGTDALGRDVLARVLATARGSLLFVVAAMVVAMVLGTAIGVVVGFAGGRLERMGVAALAGWTAFPGEIVAVALLAFNGRDGKRAAIALAFVAAPSIASGAQRRTVDALRRSDARLASGPWLKNVGSRAARGLMPAALATMFVGASHVVVAELVAGLLGVGPTATQTWSHEIVMQLSTASRAPLAIVAPVSVALVTAVAFAGLGNAIRPARTGGSAPGQAEDPLGEDVLVHLSGATGDREGP